MKRCVTCHGIKSAENFAVRRASKDGLQPRCRQCAREYYAANIVRMSATSAARIERNRAQNRRQLVAYFAEHPCVDCGEADIRVLDFDHREGVEKKANIARMLASLSWKAILTEIDKCDVRCSNCHRRRTSERGSWWRQEVFDRTSAGLKPTALERFAAMLPTTSVLEESAEQTLGR